VVHTEGQYGLLACYGDDPTTPADEGARAGEARYDIGRLSEVTGQKTKTKLARFLKPLYFAASIAIPPQTAVRLVLSETAQSDTSSNKYVLEEVNIHAADNTLMYPWSSSRPAVTLSTDGGATFAETANILPSIFFVLDSNNPFLAGPLLTHPGMSGGMRG